MSHRGAATVRRFASLSALLIGVDFLDEFAGVGPVGSPGIQGDFGISYTTAALVLFTIPGIVSLLIEPPFYLLGDRYPKKRFVIGGLASQGVLTLAAGIASSFWAFASVLSLSQAASGVGINLAQATLMDAEPDERERMMTRWTFAGSLGDLATPALFGVLAGFSLGWRSAFVIVGTLTLAYAGVLALQRFPGPSPAERDAPPTPTLREALRGAAKNRRLWFWLTGAWLCDFMDEILVAFAALHLGSQLGATAAERSYVLMALMFGALLGLIVVERLLHRVAPIRLLGGAAAACAVFYTAWLASPNLWIAGALMFATGVFIAPMYPIAQAQAYRALPDQSGMVNAASTAFAPLSIAAPLVIGFAADNLGLYFALALLLIQPVGLAAIAFAAPRLLERSD